MTGTQANLRKGRLGSSCWDQAIAGLLWEGLPPNCWGAAHTNVDGSLSPMPGPGGNLQPTLVHMWGCLWPGKLCAVVMDFVLFFQCLMYCGEEHETGDCACSVPKRICV